MTTTPDPAEQLAIEVETKRKTLLAKGMMLAKEIGLTDEARHELSIMVVGANHSPSWAKFNVDQIGRTCDYLSGWTFVEKIRRDMADRARYDSLVDRETLR